jgi:hypothetical protein
MEAARAAASASAWVEKVSEKYAVDSIGPAAVVLDNLVGDVRHETPFEYAGGGNPITPKDQRRASEPVRAAHHQLST